MGPSAIRLAGIKERLIGLGHTVERACIDVAQYAREFMEVENPKAKFLTPIVKVAEELAAEVDKTLKEGFFPLVIGGDHSAALGSIAGASAEAKRAGKRLGVLYVDAHGDFNTTETTPSGNIHGECLSASAGIGLEKLCNLYFPERKVDPKNICFVGARDIDPGERELMRNAGTKVFSMSDIDLLGFPKVIEEVKSFFASRVDSVHVSFDLDAIDPMYAPGTGIRVDAGLTNREVLLLMEQMNLTGLVTSAELVELNPVLDIEGKTARLAVSLLARLLGETLY